MKILRAGMMCLIFFSGFFCSLAFGVEEIYAFDSTPKKMQFQQIIQELRCLVCQNQNLADSDATLAKDLRQVIYQRIKKGDSTADIKNYLVSRYGEFILFRPAFSPLTYCLWLSPFILLVSILFRLLIGMRGFEPQAPNSR